MDPKESGGGQVVLNCDGPVWCKREEDGRWFLQATGGVLRGTPREFPGFDVPNVDGFVNDTLSILCQCKLVQYGADWCRTVKGFGSLVCVHQMLT